MSWPPQKRRKSRWRRAARRTGAAATPARACVASDRADMVPDSTRTAVGITSPATICGSRRRRSSAAHHLELDAAVERVAGVVGAGADEGLPRALALRARAVAQLGRLPFEPL